MRSRLLPIACGVLLSFVLIPLSTGAAAPLFELRAELAGGTLEGALFAAGDGSAPQLRFELTARGVELGKLPRLADMLTGVPADIDLRLSGAGTTVGGFLAGARGRIRVAAGEGRILNSEASLAESDVLIRTLQTLRRDSGSKTTVPRLICGALEGPVDDGVLTLDRGLAFETDKLYAVGSGTIRLADQRLDVSVRPTVREGLGLGAAGLAKAVRIQGTIDEPSFGVDAAGAAEAGVQAGAAVATGGLSILAQKLFSDAIDDPHPCFTLSGGGPPAGKTKTDAGLLESARDGVGDTVESAAEGVGNLFRGIRDAFD